MKKAEAISILATSVRPREAKDRARYDEAVKMAIEALKSSEQTVESAQNVQDEDLISKLSEIRSEYNCFDEDGEPQYRALSEAIRILSQLADGDTISRQAAIDCVTYDVEHTIECLKALSSAQPDIIRCKDCKYWREHKYAKETKRYIPFCGFNAIYTKADDFCSKAERRTE